ncbi:hypothetical protein TSMEX_003968 [Taenia solium]|eukprot:TsM_000344600 transcript=TsM_000344600 gene=TsM_000344600
MIIDAGASLIIRGLILKGVCCWAAGTPFNLPYCLKTTITISAIYLPIYCYTFCLLSALSSF